MNRSYAPLVIVIVSGLLAAVPVRAQTSAEAVPPSPTPGGPNPPTAIGGYVPTLQPDLRSRRFGPFTLTPTLVAAAGYDDNVNLRSTNKVSSAIYTLTPGLTATTRRGGHGYYLRYLGNYAHYSASAVDDYDDHTLGLGAGSEWTARVRTQLRYDFNRGHDPRGATATAVGAPERWFTQALKGAVTYGAKGARGNVETDLGFSEKRYLTNRGVTSAREYEQTDFGGTFLLRMRPDVYGLVQARAARIDYRSNPSLDSTEMRYFAGARWEATAKTQGAVKAGYMTKSFADPARGDASTSAYDIGVTWSPLTYSTVTLNAVRTFSEQTSGGNFILTDNATASWNHAWSERVRSTLLLAVGRDIHEGLNRSDDRRLVGLKANYAFRRNLRFGGDLRREERSSNAPNVDYTRNLMLFTIEGSL